MKAKALEIRDHMTFIAMLAVDMKPDTPMPEPNAEAQRYLLRRCGYSCAGSFPPILFARLDGYGLAATDPYAWPDGCRTYRVAHLYVTQHWDKIADGDVIDVEFILGETKEIKKSERWESQL